MNGSRRVWFGVLALAWAIVWLAPGVGADDKKAGGSATGTWKSSFTNNNGQTFETTYKLKQDGEKLTGTVTGRDGKEAKIEEGKVKDGKVSFQVTREFNDRKFTIKYNGDLSGDSIKGKIEFGQGDQARSFDWEAKRQAKGGKGAEKQSK